MDTIYELFLFYASYAGVMHLGFNDGIYLLSRSI